MDRRLTFNGVVDVYERVRPSYPEDLVDALFSVLPRNPKILETGPGTGQLTAMLLDRGARVTAIELGPDLAAFVEAKLGGANLTVMNGAFEEVAPIPDGFDAVVAASSYHWVEAQAKIEKPRELLRPGGYLAVIDLLQVDSENDRGYFDRVQEIYDRYGNKERRWEPMTYESAVPDIATALQESGRYEVEVHGVHWDQTYTSAEYRDLLWSYSGTQLMDEPERTSMVDELVAVVADEFDDSVTRPLLATLTLARVSSVS